MFIYRELVLSKLCNLKPAVTKLYHTSNNLNPDLLTALKELINLVKNKNIVISKADKDGKIIVLDFANYINIMNRELKTFTLRSDINNNNVYKHFDEIRKHNDSLIIELHKQGIIDDFLLKHIIGVKCYGNKYMHTSGSIAKHFSCLTLAHIYPLFKTHKLILQQLVSFPITYFPVQLLQSAGYITTSHITAFLKYILNPISKQFCQFQFINIVKIVNNIYLNLLLEKRKFLCLTI